MFSIERQPDIAQRLTNKTKWCFAFVGTMPNYALGIRVLRCADDRHMRFDDAGLLRRDLLQRTAEPCLMIKIYRRDRADGRFARVRRIESSAHARLEHDDLATLLLEMQKRERGGDFEKRRMRIPRGH